MPRLTVAIAVWLLDAERVREYAAPLRSGSCQGRQTMSLSIQLRAGASKRAHVGCALLQPLLVHRHFVRVDA